MAFGKGRPPFFPDDGAIGPALAKLALIGDDIAMKTLVPGRSAALRLGVATLIAALAWSLGSATIRAAPSTPPPTQLSLAVTGHADHAPDQMLATLTVESQSPSPAKAQADVNRRMAALLAGARALKGLRATTGSYSVEPTDQKRTRWRAEQTATLTFDAAPDTAAAAPVRKLIGTFQHDGILLDSIGAGLSEAALRQTRSAAIADAVGQMRAEARAAATALGATVGPVTHMQIATRSPIRPMMMMATRAAPSGPQVQAGPISEEINLSATITLSNR
ncbi:hypothetical protein AA700_0727 [Acidiphilium acidophilum DSM 700]|nr:hypothetical protein AA700_0727 [Acidiphilium acidophilum DSM 700]